MKAKFFNFKTIFPVTATELFVLLFFIAVYMSFGWFIASEFRLVYDERVPWDAYFSFDNYSIVNTGGGWERHPFSIYLFDVIRDIALYISGGKTDSTFRIVLMAFSATTVAFTMLQFYKYFRNIIKLPVAINLFLLLFFSFFTTPVLLSFTPETYTYSFFPSGIFQLFCGIKTHSGKEHRNCSSYRFWYSYRRAYHYKYCKGLYPFTVREGSFQKMEKDRSFRIKSIDFHRCFYLPVFMEIRF